MVTHPIIQWNQLIDELRELRSIFAPVNAGIQI